MIPNEELPFWNNQVLILESEDNVAYYTRITEIIENAIFIQYPVNTDHLPMHQAGEKQVSVHYFNDLNERYKFNTILKNHDKKIFFSTPAAKGIQKVQRRQFFRVPAVLPFWLEDECGGKRRFITDDISAGGVAFLSLNTELLNVNSIVTGGLKLDDKTRGKMEILFNAKIVHRRSELNDRNRVALQFIDMKESQRSKLIQYCLHRQIEIRNMF